MGLGVEKPRLHRAVKFNSMRRLWEEDGFLSQAREFPVAVNLRRTSEWRNKPAAESPVTKNFEVFVATGTDRKEIWQMFTGFSVTKPQACDWRLPHQNNVLLCKLAPARTELWNPLCPGEAFYSIPAKIVSVRILGKGESPGEGCGGQ